ncbi:putative GNAT family N-acyltransferase [Virgibacillus halotolerans]|uniref:GNAT family N-acetyltransferase n=1 Tax=Virgibacillus halotolerans TaxID=1071053 RepID=UPI00196205F7|nr:putative GNAT family N-acyltransferase [Virgibacillus halotolerans]
MNIKTVKSKEELAQAYHVRMVVFVEEQKVPAEEELDEYDKTSTHFIGYEGNEVIATSRLRFADDYGKLERICILKDHRGKSHGSHMIEAMEAAITEKGYTKAKLNAQTHAIAFYKRLGYEVVSGEFMDAGIPHVTMIKQL